MELYLASVWVCDGMWYWGRVMVCDIESDGMWYWGRVIVWCFVYDSVCMFICLRFDGYVFVYVSMVICSIVYVWIVGE